MATTKQVEADVLLEPLLNKLEALLNERASAAVLREHLGLLRARIEDLERENERLSLEAQQAQAHAQERQTRLDRFAKDNPRAWRCDACGSVDLARTGSRPDPTFGDVGIKQAVMTCRVCGAQSRFTDAD